MRLLDGFDPGLLREMYSPFFEEPFLEENPVPEGADDGSLRSLIAMAEALKPKSLARELRRGAREAETGRPHEDERSQREKKRAARKARTYRRVASQVRAKYEQVYSKRTGA